MKEQRIAVPVQLTKAQLDAFLNFSPCLETFDAVLDSELLEEFKKLRGLMRVSPRQRLESLKKRWIYGLSSYHGNWQVGFHLGFWRAHPDPGVVSVQQPYCLNPTETLSKFWSRMPEGQRTSIIPGI